MLPLRDVVVYPHMVHSAVRRAGEVHRRRWKAAMDGDKQILLVAQKSADIDEPGAEDLYERRHGGHHPAAAASCPTAPSRCWWRAASVPRIERSMVERRLLRAPMAAARSRRPRWRSRGSRSLMRSLMSLFEQYVKLNKKVPPEMLTSLSGHRRARPAGRYHRRAHVAASSRKSRSILEIADVRAAHGAPDGADRGRDRSAPGGEAYPRPGQAADGEVPARVLSQ
ncbi:MAG: hypothetical protein U5L11_11500 [Arhodomonas sp.]|nr:hypothetical protein [Arhodomonas sp.]